MVVCGDYHWKSMVDAPLKIETQLYLVSHFNGSTVMAVLVEE
jgi:hypothetical protein